MNKSSRRTMLIVLAIAAVVILGMVFAARAEGAPIPAKANVTEVAVAAPVANFPAQVPMGSDNGTTNWYKNTQWYCNGGILQFSISNWDYRFASGRIGQKYHFKMGTWDNPYWRPKHLYVDNTLIGDLRPAFEGTLYDGTLLLSDRENHWWTMVWQNASGGTWTCTMGIKF